MLLIATSSFPRASRFCENTLDRTSPKPVEVDEQHSESIVLDQPHSLNEPMKSIRHFRMFLIVVTTSFGAATFAESDAERAMRMENERVLNEANMRIMKRNLEEDDAFRARAQQQRNAPQAAGRDETSVEAREEKRKKLIEVATRKIGAPIRSAQEFDGSEISDHRSAKLAAQKMGPVKLVKWTHTTRYELDATSVVRDSNVVQFVLVAKAKMDGVYSAVRINATCGRATPQMQAVGNYLANDKIQAALHARDQLALARGGIEYFPVSPAMSKTVQGLCASAAKPHHPILITVASGQTFASFVPARSIRRELDGVTSWIRFNADKKDISHTEARVGVDAVRNQLALRCGADSSPWQVDIGLTDLGVHVYSVNNAPNILNDRGQVDFVCAAAGFSS